MAKRAETTLMLTPKTTLDELAKAKRDTKKRTQSMSATLGEKIGAAVENKHLDRKAFSIACQLFDLDDERLHVTFFNLMYYLDVLGVEKRATAQEELFVKGPKEEDDEAEVAAAAKKPKANGKANGKGKKDNVVQIGKAARDVVEKAGGASADDDGFHPTH